MRPSPPCAKVKQPPLHNCKQHCDKVSITYLSHRNKYAFQRVQGLRRRNPSAFACVFLFRGIPDHWRLKAQKGRDDVNRFKDAKEMLGEVNVKELGVTFVEFIELARLIRNKLGCRKYLLDRYLLDLLEAASGISPMDLAEAGEDAAERLRKLCRQAVRKDEAVRETLIGEQIQAYVEAHPSAYFEKCTKQESYVADLSDLYLEHAAQRYLEEQENELLFRYDPHGGDELYQTIVRLIGGENDMERLNALFAERFLRVKPMDLYIQEYTQEFLYSLLYRDMQTDRTVLQILLDRQEP